MCLRGEQNDLGDEVKEGLKKRQLGKSKEGIVAEIKEAVCVRGLNN